MTDIRVPTLNQATPIVDGNGNPSPAFVQWFNNSISQIVSTLNGVVTAQNAAAAAQTSANNAAASVAALTTTNVAEGTNKYYTDARARAALSAGVGINYNSATGAITNTGATGFSYTVNNTATGYTEATTTGFKVIIFTASGQTLTLPTAIGNSAMFTVKVLSGSATVVPFGTEKIDGGASYSLITGGSTVSVTLISDGAGWRSIAFTFG